ncbi:MAG: putative DNA binding domain-containing protein [Steroidobacteraceae bacterium]|jgi:ATP-dependent DNA helicase RecG|nr:putative DNA binding domain-containing protein [Steroidobacteraceae bacterium]
MTSTEAQLELFDQLSPYEGVDVEYKSAKGGLPRDLWETYSAFANTDGGTIWLGIAQREGHLEPHGLDNVEKLLTDFWNTVNNRDKVSCNLLSERSVQRVPLPASSGREVVCIQVPRADRRQRPVYVGHHPLSGTFRRNHEGDYRCTEDEVRRMFADRPEHAADGRVVEHFEWTDLDLESIRQFRSLFAAARPGHPWIADTDQDLLLKLGALQRDRPSGRLGVTVAGLLMFGKHLAITAPEAVPGFHVDYRERFSDDPAIRWTDRLTSDGTWEANLFQFYRRVTVLLSTGPGVKQPFQRDPEGYRRQVTPVHEALQEALVNALIHADYSGQGGIVIDRYVDRLEFSNPGTLLVSREQLQRGGISECRNKSLQKMFQILGVGDRAGSGIDKIRSSWDAQHWQSPLLGETRGPERVRLVLPMISTLPGEAVESLRALFGPELEALSPDELQVLVAAELESHVTNQRLQDMISMHRADITVLLRGLVRRGFLLQEGIGRGTRYQLPTRGPSTPAKDPDSPAKGPNSPAKDPDSPAKGPNSPAKDPDSPAKTSVSAEEAEDPDLLRIAEPVRTSRRAARETVRKAILDLCTGRYLTLPQIGALLKRRPAHLRDDYVTPMTRDGELELRYPDTPNRPDQAYRRAEGR